MPNFKIIQDVPDQARIKIYGSENAALITTDGGYLSITAPAAGLNIAAPVNGLLVTAADTGLSVTGPANGLIVTAPATGLSVTPPSGGLLITSSGLSVISALATTDVTEAKTGIIDIVGSPSATYNVLGIAEYTFGLVNRPTSAANAQATAKLQISPDGVTWFDNSAVVTLNQNSADALVSSIFLKYARVYYAAVNAASSVDLTIFLQGQTS